MSCRIFCDTNRTWTRFPPPSPSPPQTFPFSYWREILVLLSTMAIRDDRFRLHRHCPDIFFWRRPHLFYCRRYHYIRRRHRRQKTREVRCLRMHPGVLVVAVSMEIEIVSSTKQTESDDSPSCSSQFSQTDDVVYVSVENSPSEVDRRTRRRPCLREVAEPGRAREERRELHFEFDTTTPWMRRLGSSLVDERRRIQCVY